MIKTVKTKTKLKTKAKLNVRKILYEDKDIRIGCDYLNDIKKISLHLDITEGSWSCSIYKKIDKVFKTLMAEFKGDGYTELYATPFKSDKKAQKLISMFGFKIINDHNDLTVMKIKI